MALLNNSSVSSVSSTSSVVSDLDAKLKAAIRDNMIVFKLQLNANPSKVNARKVEGFSASTITNLGGCGSMKVNSRTGLVFFDVNNRPMKKDSNQEWLYDSSFSLPLYRLELDEDAAQVAKNLVLASHGIKTEPTESFVKEVAVSAESLQSVMEVIYGSDHVSFYFNDNRQDQFLSNYIDEMKDETGLLTVYFSLDKTSVGAELIEVNKASKMGIMVPKLNAGVIHMEFEAGKSVFVPKAKLVAGTARLAAGLSVLKSNLAGVSSVNAHGNVELPDAFFEAIARKREASLSAIGTGKKAHHEFKKTLVAAVEAGGWDTVAEQRLLWIAQRGFNIHYTVVNHDRLMSDLRKQLVDCGVNVVEAVHVVVTPVAASVSVPTTTASVTSIDEDTDDEDDFVFTPDRPFAIDADDLVII